MRLILGLAMIAAALLLWFAPRLGWSVPLPRVDFGFLWSPWDAMVAGLDPRWQTVLGGAQGHTLVLGGLAFGFLALLSVWARSLGRVPRRADNHEQIYHSTTWVERLGSWLVPPKVGWIVGDVVCALTWHPHAILFGAPGSGKSTFMYTRIMDPPTGLPALVARLRRRKRGRLIITGNRSDPFRAAMLQLQEAGEEAWIWSPGTMENQGDRAAVVLDVLEGPPDNVAQRIIAMHPVGANSTGLRAGAVEGVLIAAVELMDQLDVSRTFENLMPVARHVARELSEAGELSQQGRAGLDDWLERLRTLRRQFGDNIGPGLQISQALARGAVIMIELSAYRDPTKTGPLAAFFVVFAMWLVSSQGDFDLILDEAGATDATLYARIFQATRAAGVRITAGGQSPAQFDDTIREMCSTVVLCGVAIASPEAAQWASNVTKRDVEPADFTLLQPMTWGERLAIWSRKRGLRALQGYVLHNGRLDRVRTRPVDLAIIKRYPWGSIASPTHAEAGRAYRVVEVDFDGGVPRVVVPLLAAGTGGEAASGYGTQVRDSGNGTHTVEGQFVELDGWVRDGPPQLAAGVRPSPPGYFVAEPLLLKEWDGLTGTFDANGCWLIDRAKTNGKANRSKIWVPKGTSGWGETVLKKGGYVTGYLIACVARRGPRPYVRDAKGEVRKDIRGRPLAFQVDHWCHTEDLTCPGGEACQHVRCLNGDHMSWVSPQANTVRMRVRQQRRELVLGGERQRWRLSVAEEADRLIAERGELVA